MITRELCFDVKPGWLSRPADRYLSHPDISASTIQMADDPLHVYVVTGRAVPNSLNEAKSIVAEWRQENEWIEP